MHRYVFMIAGCMFLISIPQDGISDSLESIFSPGELSRVHSRYEEQCNKCHDKADKERQDQLCLDCHDHKDIANDINRQQGFHGRIKMQGKSACKQCHREHRGIKVEIALLSAGSFDHGTTDFRLKGNHMTIDCQSCHKQGKKYREAPSDCYSCHKKQDVHKGDLGRKCQSCHVENGWTTYGFNHEKGTDFPLRGKHKDVDCQLCHVGNKYKKTLKTCVSCHSLNDVHGGRYDKKCHACHTENEWTRVRFDHTRDTKYKLTGKHRVTDCDNCHTGFLYKQKLKTTCYSCHRNDDEHKGKNSEKCQECHTTQGWGRSLFSHNDKTDFPLTGKHKELECETCHRESVSKKLGKDCYICHKHSDPHKEEMGKNCSQCHNTNGWREKLFFEHDISRFPLIGIHAVTACEECHISQVFTEAPIQCIRCHKTQDEHKERLGENCGSCHNPNSWKTWLFDHNQQTDFKLDGTHAEIDCYSCHRTSMSKNYLVSNCAGCHSGDDIHQGGFGQYCDRCHNTRDFREINMTGTF